MAEGRGSEAVHRKALGSLIQTPCTEQPRVVKAWLRVVNPVQCDPSTDHSLHSNACVDSDSPHSGGLATQTAITVPDSPGLIPDSAVSHGLDPVHPDGFPSSQISEVHDGLTTISHVPDQRDGCPSSAELSECRDGFPRPGDTENSDTAFSRDFHAEKNSDRVRQSDSGVQIVPASRSPSELSAHQMGASLAGTIRLKSEPIGIDPTGILDIGERERLTIADRALASTSH